MSSLFKKPKKIKMPPPPPLPAPPPKPDSGQAVSTGNMRRRKKGRYTTVAAGDLEATSKKRTMTG